MFGFAIFLLETVYPNAPVSFTLPTYVKYVFTFFIGISGLIAFGVLIWAGIIYLTSAGNVDKMKEAREKIFSAFLGISILLGSYILLSTINPQLVVFSFPPLPNIPAIEPTPSPTIEINKSSLISKELPLEQSMVNGVWKDEQILKTQDIMVRLEDFLNQPTKVNDSSLKNDVFTSISSLNKYLQKASAECRCENLTTYAAKPEEGGATIGHLGDVCQTKQGVGVQPGSPREKINKVLELNKQKSSKLLDFKKEVDNQRASVEKEIRKYQTLENEVSACESQKGELVVLNSFLANKQTLGESGIQSIAIPSFFPPKQSNLTFYCSAGGTIFDSNYNPSSPLEGGEEKTGCPVELNTGGILDNLRELAILENFKLANISALADDLIKEVENMGELVSRCDDSQCQDSSACFPNPCYLHCEPLPLDPCISIIFACRSPCFQTPGGTHGTVCPREDIEKKIAEMEKTEKDLRKEIENLNDIFPKIPNLKTALNNLDVSIGLCSSSDLTSAWEISTCQSAIDNGDYDKNGQLISLCHPRNLFCCTSSPYKLPLANTDTAPFYILPQYKYAPLPNVNGCPKGWLCDAMVSAYNEYKDASDPLKQLFACMRPILDTIKESAPIGLIGSITDPGIYQKTCGWETGAAKTGGCQYAYQVEYGKEKVSAHYGGLSCRYDHQSYAVDISLQGELQKKYAKEIMDAAKTCSPGAYILNEYPYLHIDVAQLNQCSASE